MALWVDNLTGETLTDNNGGQLHTIQVDEGDHGPAQSNEIELQASPVLNNTSFTSGHSSETPPPNGSLSDIQTQTEPILDEPAVNCFDMHKTFLGVSVNELLATSAVRFSAGHTAQENIRILLSSAQLSSLAATVFCSCGYLLERSHRSNLARMMTAGGIVAATCTLGLLTASLLANF